MSRRWNRPVNSSRATKDILAPQRGETVVDIGCNMGAFLLPFAEAGCEVAGVDFGKAHVREGRRLTGIESLYVGGSQELIARDIRADIVILNHVVEHFTDLESEFRRVRRLCHDGTRVFVAVPGSRWWIRHRCGGDPLDLLQNVHTYQFDLATLRYVMECVGFELLSGDERVEAVFRPAESYREVEDVPHGHWRAVRRDLRAQERRYRVKNGLAQIAESVGLRRSIGRMTRRLFRPL
jgi:2-polyprenyl-3-methyl-5-hydroxy-6-metoxy-1,4-benzoquinol methylase